MKLIYALIISSVAGFATMIGGLFSFINIKKENQDKFITLCLSFSLAIMISISIFELIPESFINLLKTYSAFTTNLILMIFFLLGTLIILIINKFIVKFSKNEKSLYKLGILNMIALMVHNFPEGIASFMSSYADISLGIKIAVALMLHNIPEGIGIAIPVYYATNSRKKALKLVFISSLAEPLGAILSYIFLKNYINNLSISIILILVAGIMITLSIHEILPEAKKYNEDKILLYGLLIGVIITLINVFAF